MMLITACYTFGSPRIGNDQWIASLEPPIKVPIYRVVNAIDSVTMLPSDSLKISIVCWILDRTMILKPLAKWIRHRFGGYMHAGDMRYLTNCSQGDYTKVKLLYGVSTLFRARGAFRTMGSSKKLLRDHKIAIYKTKLKILAEQRNPK